MELANEQLRMLLRCAIWIVRNAPQKDTRDELKRLGLLSYEQQDESGYRNPNEMSVWRLTYLGREVLQKNIVRALCMYSDQYHTEGSRSIVHLYVNGLSVEDLPLLLTCRTQYIRTYAKERMEELQT